MNGLLLIKFGYERKEMIDNLDFMLLMRGGWFICRFITLAKDSRNNDSVKINAQAAKKVF